VKNLITKSTLYIGGIGFFLSCSTHSPTTQPEESEFNELKIMTYNVLYSSPNETTLQVLRETDADIIGLQEISATRLGDLAQRLHYQQYSFSSAAGNQGSNDTGVLCRFPISRALSNGVVVRVNPSLEVAVFTVHLPPYPYQPYDFRDGKITTATQAIASAVATRLSKIQSVLDEIKEMQNNNIPVFLTGDFNEPSHLDWTSETASLNLHFGKAVEWPVSKIIYTAGFIDAYRTKFENPANFYGITWTTIENANEVYDRIDMIYQTETQEMTLQEVRLVGGPGDSAGITVQGYPSDHYAVIAYYKL
jgi:exonuclease III